MNGDHVLGFLPLGVFLFFGEEAHFAIVTANTNPGDGIQRLDIGAGLVAVLYAIQRI